MPQAKYFSVSLITIKEMRGNTPRWREKFPWADDMPALFNIIKALTDNKITLMGPSTFRAFNAHDVSRNQFIGTDNVCFVLTRNKLFELPTDIPMVQKVLALSALGKFWHATNTLERAEDEKRQKILERTPTPISEEHLLSFTRAQKYTQPEIVAIGGEKLYAKMLPYAKTLHTLLIYHELPGDVTLPTPDPKIWKRTGDVREYKATADENKFLFLHVCWERIKTPPSKLSCTPFK